MEYVLPFYGLFDERKDEFFRYRGQLKPVNLKFVCFVFLLLATLCTCSSLLFSSFSSLPPLPVEGNEKEERNETKLKEEEQEEQLQKEGREEAHTDTTLLRPTNATDNDAARRNNAANDDHAGIHAGIGAADNNDDPVRSLSHE